MSELTEDAPLVKNRYGIEEPATLKLLPASAFDVIVVPIVAFDANGHRLGHGMGYYDRYLVHTTACKIGVAFDCQQVAQIDSRPQQSMISAALQERVKRSRGFFV